MNARTLYICGETSDDPVDCLVQEFAKNHGKVIELAANHDGVIGIVETKRLADGSPELVPVRWVPLSLIGENSQGMDELDFEAAQYSPVGYALIEAITKANTIGSSGVGKSEIWMILRAAAVAVRAFGNS
jgi:hypothetical protein